MGRMGVLPFNMATTRALTAECLGGATIGIGADQSEMITAVTTSYGESPYPKNAKSAYAL